MSNLAAKLSVLLAIIVATTALNYEYVQQASKLWPSFKQEHNLTYATAEEDQRRLNMFIEGYIYVQEQNLKYARGESTFYVELNEFAVYTQQEIDDYLGARHEQEFTRMIENTDPKDREGEEFFIPEHLNLTHKKSFDWRQHGAVTPIKNQGGCGSCWTFAVAGSMEGQLAIHKKFKSSLSPQQILDCAPYSAGKGCSGGSAVPTYKWMKSKGLGMMKWSDYKYKGKKEKCKYQKAKAHGKVTGYIYKVKPSFDTLATMVETKGPVNIGVFADSKFLAYKGGILDNKNAPNSKTNHAVLLVGFSLDISKNIKYWIIKNSYGVKKGDYGYWKIRATPGNQYAVRNRPVVPIIA